MYTWGNLFFMFVAGWLGRSALGVYREAVGPEKRDPDWIVSVGLLSIGTGVCLVLGFV